MVAFTDFSKKELGFGIGGWGGVRYKVIRTPKGKTLSNNNKKKVKQKRKNDEKRREAESF